MPDNESRISLYRRVRCLGIKKDKVKNDNRVIIIRKKSEEAISILEDNSLDFLYIDGNHKKEFIKKDLELYFPKIKIGGFIGGDDYVPKSHPRELKKGVREAVDEFIELY